MPESSVVQAGIAHAVRSGRQARGWSMDALATRSGVSKGALLAIEQARGNPSIATLCRIADALGVALAQLVDLGQAPSIRVVRPEQTALLWTGQPGSSATLVLGTDAPGVLEVWQWRLTPGDGYDGEAHGPGVREMVHVIDGTLTLRAGDHSATVVEGGGAVFSGDQPHRYANEHDVPLRFVMVVEQAPSQRDSRPGGEDTRK